jgi:hypothetical protein
MDVETHDSSILSSNVDSNNRVFQKFEETCLSFESAKTVTEKKVWNKTIELISLKITQLLEF